MSTVTTIINEEDNQDLYDEKRKLEVINETVFLKFKVCFKLKASKICSSVSPF